MTLPPPNRAKRTRELRIRSAKHLAFVRSRLCAAWAHKECLGRVEAAHLRELSPEKGMGTKPSDIWVVGLCKHHHAFQHQIGESKFEEEYGLDLVALAMEYAQASPDKAVRDAAKEMRKP